jgi:hypothetical protein
MMVFYRPEEPSCLRLSRSRERMMVELVGERLTDLFVPYTVILYHGALSPAEDLETAIIAAAQSEACGQPVARIERGAEVILEGEELRDTIARYARDADCREPRAS